MERYRNLHLWLLIPFAIAVLGFMRSYYLDFTNVPWGNHVHGLSATLWFVLVVVQPYLATRGRLVTHRALGRVGIFLAGAVFASALVRIPGNIRFAREGTDSPIAPDVFLYGVSFFDLVAITGFAVSVVVAVLRSRRLEEHAVWMVSTVLWALMPALTRLALLPTIRFYGVVDFASLAMIVTPAIMLTAVVMMIRLRRAHPALVAVVVGHLSVYLIRPLGQSQTWIDLATAVFSY